MALAEWAVPQLTKLLPLDNESLTQIVTYTDTLPRTAAAEHLRNLLGDSAQALEFISTFQSRRTKPPAEAVTPAAISNNPSRDTSDAEVPRPERKSRKKKTPFNELPPARKVEDRGYTSGGYLKRDEDDYMTGRSTNRRPHKEPPLANTLALQSKPDALQRPIVSSQPTSPGRSPAPQSRSKLPPSAIGPLISDSLNSSRSASPAKKPSNQSSNTKINLTGGTAMRGAGSALSDLDSAIRQLEVSTNPTLASASDTMARRCNCMAQRHALLTAAPNCLSCGKIICAKEGLGPCTFCDTPLLKSSDVQEMLQALKAERGRERQEANSAANRRAEVARTPRAFAPNPTDFPANGPSYGSTDSAPATDATLARAKEHRDKLLSFQSQNAKRTRIHDEAADYETPDAGVSQWASASERALQLKLQQKVLREQEWNARPEYEKRRMVVSLDVDKDGKARAVRRFEKVEGEERKVNMDVDADEGGDVVGGGVLIDGEREGRGTSNFSRSPLLGGLIRPVYTPARGGTGGETDVSKGKGPSSSSSSSHTRKSAWRRVQDDNDDNEGWILDGGAYGDRIDARVLGAEEKSFG